MSPKLSSSASPTPSYSPGYGAQLTWTSIALLFLLSGCEAMGSATENTSDITSSQQAQTIRRDLLLEHFEASTRSLVPGDSRRAEHVQLTNGNTPRFSAERRLANGMRATASVVDVGGRTVQRGRFFAAGTDQLIGTRSFFADRVLVQLANTVEPARGRARIEALGYKVMEMANFGLARVQVPVTSPESVLTAQAALGEEPGLAAHVSLDELIPVTVTPNDPLLCGQFIHHVDGVTAISYMYVESSPGTWVCGSTSNSDGKNAIGTPNAWDIRTDASQVKVAVIDTGFDYTHPDLVANTWTNPDEIPGNGVDDDADGYVDDVHGINAVKMDGDPQEDGNNHGTSCVGLIGASGNNGVGIAGMAWKTTILGIRTEPDKMYGELSLDAIVRGVDFAIAKQVKIINMSFGTTEALPTLADAIARAKAADIIVVASAGNDNMDIDATPFYPASYKLIHDNIVVVGGSGWQFGDTWQFNWGARTVDLAAPSDALVTTFPWRYPSRSGYPQGYFLFSGTSAAAPVVTGSMALLAAQFPAAGYRNLINRLLAGTVTEPNFQGKCVSGGRLNVYRAMTTADPTVYKINCGSSMAASPFTSDQYATGGTQRTVTNPINLSGVANPAPQTVYQSERYGNTTYRFPSLIAGSTYTVRLHFAELYQTATGKRLFNVAINGTPVLSNFDIYATAGGNYKAVVREFTATATPSGEIVIVLTKMTDNATISGIEILTALPNQPPSFTTAAGASQNPVIGNTTMLSALASDDGGEANLIYTWATTGTPPAAVTFSANGTNVAKATTATFTKPGNYSLQVTVHDQPGLSTTSTVLVTVDPTLTSIVVSPANATVAPSGTQPFTVSARDQFGIPLTTQPALTWSVSGGGTISATGLFTAGIAAGGPYTLTAKYGSVSGSANVTVSAATNIAYQINCGGNAASPFKADQYAKGGTQRTVTNTITIGGIANPAPAAVYKSERYGNSTYTFPGLNAGTQYTVRLHFAELYQKATGKRLFNVAINGKTVLSKFDIYATAGAAYKAVLKEFSTTANSSGQIVVVFTTVTDNATIGGIEIIKK